MLNIEVSFIFLTYNMKCNASFVSRYIEDCVTKEEALALLNKSAAEKKIREEYLAAEGKLSLLNLNFV